jgi:hypothetical protein
VKLVANDVIGDGWLDVYYNPSAPKPLGIDFKKDYNEDFDNVECNVSVKECKERIQKALDETF